MTTMHLETADQLREVIVTDTLSASRYAVRFILVDGLEAWRETLAVLEGISQKTVRLSTLVDGNELPAFQRVVEGVATLNAPTTLLPLGEILRLAHGVGDEYISWLATISAPGKARLYVPMLGVSGHVMSALESMYQYLEYSPPIWCVDSPGTAKVEVVSADYGCLPGLRLHGTQKYLRQWEDGGTSACLLITPDAGRHRSSHSAVELEVLPSAFDVVRACCADAAALERRWGQDTQWDWLAMRLKQGESIASGTPRLLGLATFQPEQLWALWSHLDANGKWLAWLWAKGRLTGESAAAEAVQRSESPEQFIEAAFNAVFERDIPTTEWLRERKQFLNLLSDRAPDSFWRRFAQLASPMQRLAALPGLSDREREAVVEALGQLMDSRIPQDRWLAVLQVAYPDLYTYLTASQEDAWLGEYLAMYRASRIADKASPSLLDRAAEWAQRRLLWDYDTRAQALERFRVDADGALWVDGMGLEWLGLLWHKLITRGWQVNVQVARANLPSVTASNHDWTTAEVIRGMDVYAHSHEYAYPQAIIRQIRVIDDIVERIQARLQDSPEVVVTSDHGLTRFASAGDRVDVPDGYEAHRWGRHASAVGQDRVPARGDGLWIEDGAWLSLACHGLFRGGSSVGGEVHGGATPEESLVPVLRVSVPGRAAPVVLSSDAQVKLDVRNQGGMHIVLTEPCAGLSLHLPGHVFVARKNLTAGWDVDLAGLQPGSYTADLICGGGLVGTIDFECVRGMVENNLGL